MSTDQNPISYFRNFVGSHQENQDDFTDVSFKELVVNDCFAEPCTNGATCQNLAVGYTCLCVPGWTGNKKTIWPYVTL